MKKIYFYSIMIITGICLLAACKKETLRSANVPTSISAPVLNAPQGNVAVALDPASNAVVTFSWEPAKTGNNTMAFYQVVLDKETGDFSAPLYTGTPADVGTKTSLILTHRQLNIIAAKAGIGELAKGKLKWKVKTSNGVAAAESPETRLIEVERPAGFAENPAELYLTGSATEGGTQLAQAKKFKKLSDGVFELYTSLTAGTYTLVDKTTGTPVMFTINGSTIKNGSEGASPVSTATAFRINLNFNTATAQLTEIQEVGLWFAGYNKVTNVLLYDGNGVWKVPDIAITFSAQSWGKDERYKFRIREKDMTGTVTSKFWASVTKDNSKPTASTAASYFYFGSNDASQWDYTYKFEKEAAKADVFVRFSSAETSYTHQVVYKP